MLAVFGYYEKGRRGPIKFYSLKLTYDSVEDFFSEMKKDPECPFPETEILFIEDNKIINRITL